MATDCSAALAQMKSNYAAAADYADQADWYIDQASQQWLFGNDHNAIGHLVNACYRQNSALYALVHRDYPAVNQYLVPQYFNDCAGAGDPFTLLTFIEAFIDADDDHRSAHRLLVDAYQASMYDKPFDLEYHTNWVRRFKEWR